MPLRKRWGKKRGRSLTHIPIISPVSMVPFLSGRTERECDLAKGWQTNRLLSCSIIRMSRTCFTGLILLATLDFRQRWKAIQAVYVTKSSSRKFMADARGNLPGTANESFAHRVITLSAYLG